MLSAINMSKSAFGMVKLDARTFFTAYDCPDIMGARRGEVVVRCKMQTRVSPSTLHPPQLSFFGDKSVMAEKVASFEYF